MQFPAERSHECDEPRDSPDTGALVESGQGAQALLRAHQTLAHFRAVFPRREQCHSQKVQEYGRQELRLPLIPSVQIEIMAHIVDRQPIQTII